MGPVGHMIAYRNGVDLMDLILRHWIRCRTIAFPLFPFPSEHLLLIDWRAIWFRSGKLPGRTAALAMLASNNFTPRGAGSLVSLSGLPTLPSVLSSAAAALARVGGISMVRDREGSPSTTTPAAAPSLGGVPAAAAADPAASASISAHATPRPADSVPAPALSSAVGNTSLSAGAGGGGGGGLLTGPAVVDLRLWDSFSGRSFDCATDAGSVISHIKAMPHRLQGTVTAPNKVVALLVISRAAFKWVEGGLHRGGGEAAGRGDGTQPDGDTAPYQPCGIQVRRAVVSLQ